MNAKRIVSFILTLAIVLGLCPTTFAAETVEIDYVEATINGVAIGNTTDDVTLTLDANTNYDVYIDDIYQSQTPFSGTFGMGSYTVHLHFTPKAGYSFACDENGYVDYTISGENIFVVIGPHLEDGELYFSVHYTFGTIDNIIGQLNNVAASMSVKYITPSVPSDAKYSSAIHAINKVVGDSREPFSGTLEVGTTYEAVLHFIPWPGHTFADELVQHGIYCDYIVDSTLTRQEPDLLEFVVEFFLPTPIHEVDLTVTGMEKGKSPADVEVTLPAGANYTVDIIEVVDKNGDSFSGTFENDLYIANIYLLSAEGYYFSEDMTVTVNGIAHDIYYIGEEMMVEYQLDLRTPIDKAEVTITGMEEGKSTSDVKVTVPAGANYTVDEFSVVDSNWDSFSGTFEIDRYNATIYLAPAEGYYFAHEVDITLSGSTLYSSHAPSSGTYLNVICRMENRTPIDEVEVTVTGMEDGKSAADVEVTVPTGVNYALDEIFIYDTSWEDFTGTFEKDRYIADIYLTPAEGYYFPEDVVITLNGSDPEYLHISDNGNTLNLEYHPDLRTPITQVELPAWPTAPKAGSTVPEIPAFGPSGYYCTPFWVAQDGALDPGDQFANNTVYYYLVTVLADYGFVITDDVTVTVDGEVYTGFTVDQGKQLFVFKTYSIGNGNLIDQIVLSGETPTAGKEPGEVTSTGTGYTLVDAYWGVADNGNASNISTPTKPFQVGEYVYLGIDIQPTEGYSFDLSGQILFNGKVYSPIPQYSGIDPGGTVTITICLGQVRDSSFIPGDFTGDGFVTEEDVIHLLWHTVDPDTFTLNQNGDYTGDGFVTEEDVIHLLWHTVDPDTFPLQ